MIDNFMKLVLDNGGMIKPLLVPYNIAKGTGQMNPSILIDNGKILVIVRNVGYSLIHAENEQRFPSRWGPLLYAHPENDRTLRTTNVYMELDGNFNVTRINAINTSKLDVKPLWEFIGLEDGRLVRWDNKLCLIGVRRDTTPNGVGRMEISELEVGKDFVNEVKRIRIEAPDPKSYCEKNWMPILDVPYHMVKWSNPTEVVKIDFDYLDTTNPQDVKHAIAKTVELNKTTLIGYRDWRGSSQVLSLDEHYWVALVHEVVLFHNYMGQKDAYYYERFLVWNEDWKIVGMSDCFNFMTERMGFSCGLAFYEDKVLMPFGHQDNTAYLAVIPMKFFKSLLLWKNY